MGTHPIFESDFDCLTENMERYVELDKRGTRDRDFRCATITPLETLEAGGMLHRMELMCMQVQADLTRQVEEIEPDKKFQIDEWKRPNNTGGGITMVLQDGVHFEKSGVGISVVHSKMNAPMAAQMRSRGHKLKPVVEGEPMPFSVVGVSCVTHPVNPHCPTVHFNYRYFEVQTAEGIEAWFGGGTDLTPSYLNREDIVHFHASQQAACSVSGATVHAKFKKWCDDYFRIPHRGPSGECRGVGGIFFDDVTGDFGETGVVDYEAGMRHQLSCASSICDSYFPIIRRRLDTPFTDVEKEWQQIRRALNPSSCRCHSQLVGSTRTSQKRDQKSTGHWKCFKRPLIGCEFAIYIVVCRGDYKKMKKAMS